MKFFLLLFFFLSYPLFSEESKVVAKVNGVEIKEEELIAQMNWLKSQLIMRGQDASHIPEDFLRKNALDFLIEMEIAYQSAKKQNYSVKEEEIQKRYEEFKGRFKDEKEFKDFLDRQKLDEKKLKREIEREILVNDYVEKEILRDYKPPKEEEIKKYYDENPKYFVKPENVRASHILVQVPKDATEEERKELRKKAERILLELKKGVNFEELAKAKSDCPSKERGGDLGNFQRGRMVKPFEDAAFSLKPGELSEIVETEFGYHIILLKEHNKEEKIKFEEAKDRIKNFLENNKKREIVQKKMEELISKAKVEKFIEKKDEPQREHKH